MANLEGLDVHGLEGLDYRTLWFDLMEWIQTEIALKPQQAIQSDELRDIFAARGMLVAYQGVMHHGELLIRRQLHPEDFVSPENEDSSNGG